MDVVMVVRECGIARAVTSSLGGDLVIETPTFYLPRYLGSHCLGGRLSALKLADAYMDEDSETGGGWTDEKVRVRDPMMTNLRFQLDSQAASQIKVQTKILGYYSFPRGSYCSKGEATGSHVSQWRLTTCLRGQLTLHPIVRVGRHPPPMLPSHSYPPAFCVTHSQESPLSQISPRHPEKGR